MADGPVVAFELDVTATPPAGLAERLMRGEIVILRNVPAIHRFRRAVMRYARTRTADGAPDLDAFLAAGDAPSLTTTVALSDAIKAVRRERFLSRCLAPLVAELGFGAPVRLDGGIPRLVLPPEQVRAAHESGLFAAEDFRRQTADGPTEIFMPAPANIHRDYNRQHFLFQCNMWFTLHDAEEDEVLRIYPRCYRQPVFDMDSSERNLEMLGRPLAFRLGFGDAVLFHGEHLHTSPPQSTRFRRRFSYDFRIASHCLDDTRHYREFFFDLRNFPTRAEDDPGLGAAVAASPADASALPAVLEIEQRDDFRDADFRRLAMLFETHRFAEDRYLILAERAAQRCRSVAVHALDAILERSPHWFWLATAGQAFCRLNDTPKAVAAFEKARLSAAQQPPLVNFMPIAYQRPPTQPLPQTVRMFCETALRQITAAPGRVLSR